MKRDKLLVLVVLLVIFLTGSVLGQEAQRIVVAQGEGVENWDPPAGWDTASEWIEMNVYDCLVYPDRETGEMIGWLAESWENLSDTLWRLNLRQGVSFHNGDPFTAEDAKFSIDRITSADREKFIVFNQWQFVKEVRILDDYTIEIETTGPDPSFLSELSGTGCGVISKKYVEEVGDDGLANFGVGTGPFKLVDYDRESFVVLEANEAYWGGKPDIDELVFRVIPEVSTRLAELLTGGVDIAPGILPQDWDRIESDERLKLVQYLTDRVYGLSLAQTPPPGVEAVATSIPEIREAIDYAINRDELIELAGGGTPTLTRLTPPIPCWDQVEPALYGANPYNPEMARQILADIGYPDVAGGPTITLHGTFGQYIAQKEIAETIAAMLEEVGFEVELDIREFSNFRETVYRGNNEELMLQSLGNFTTDPWLFILNYDSRFGERLPTRTRFSNEEVDTLAKQANVEMDPNQRCEIINEFAHKVADLRPTIELFQMSDTVAMPSNVEWTPPSDGMLLFVNLRFTD
jgi:peptide/nickel transport system substrate-binding protein